MLRKCVQGEVEETRELTGGRLGEFSELRSEVYLGQNQGSLGD